MLFALILLGSVAAYVLSKDCLEIEPSDNYESFLVVLNNIKDLDNDLYLKFSDMIGRGLNVDFVIEKRDRIALEAMIRERYNEIYGVIIEPLDHEYTNEQVNVQIDKQNDQNNISVDSDDSDSDDMDYDEQAHDLIDDVLDDEDNQIHMFVKSYDKTYKEKSDKLNKIVDELFESKKDI